jgi:RimJ/RimL family protein N-acetyltransferase
MKPVWDHVLRTPRLMLRSFAETDTARLCDIQSNWNVTRMLRLAAYPPDPEAMRQWLLGHREEWEHGTGYRFAVLHDGDVIGCADIDEIADGRGDLGYWLDEPFWGQGLASEAAGAVLRFALDDLGLVRLRSGHAADNPGSGRVLEKLGFRFVATTTKWSRPRGHEIEHWSYELTRGDVENSHLAAS